MHHIATLRNGDKKEINSKKYMWLAHEHINTKSKSEVMGKLYNGGKHKTNINLISKSVDKLSK